MAEHHTRLPMIERFPTRDLFGVPVRAMRMADVVALAGEAIRGGVPLLIGVVNAAKIVNMRRDATLREAVLASDVILADGVSVVWASRLLRRPLPERVAGVDLMTALLERANREGERVYFFGARQEVLDTVIDRVRRAYPNLVPAGSRNGYYDADEEASIVEAIRESKADMLFVAMSPPKKEIFLGRWSRRMAVPVCHGVGGAFDVLAGKVKRAPRVWQRLGLEWMYRVVQEPRRMWRRYLVTNTAFGWMLVKAMFGGGRVQPDGGDSGGEAVAGVAGSVSDGVVPAESSTGGEVSRS